MRFDLSDSRWRYSFLLLIVLAAAGLSYPSVRIWMAAQCEQSDDPAKWLAAAHLEPGNAQYWGRLGLYYQWNLENRNLPDAIHYLQRATEINPRSAPLWMDIAALYEAQGDPAATKQAYEMGRRDFPVSPEVAWNYGSFLLRQRNFPSAFAVLRYALMNDSSLEASALSECWHVDPDVAAITDNLLPRQGPYYVRAIRYFLSQHQTDAALFTWTRFLTLSQPVSMLDAIDLINNLMNENRVNDAQQVWNQALQRSAWPRDANENHSLVFNAGFEHYFLNGGFDWRELPISGASYNFDNSVVHSGHRSLRVAFDGSANLNFQHLYQYVPFVSHQRYRFRAYLCTEEITTDSGIRFEIFDPRHQNEVDVSTPDILGTNKWTPVQIDFESGSATHLLEILLRRKPNVGFDNKLRGIVWVDDVSLVPIADATKNSP